VPGYEVLGELGRGGMGVVYRARQTSLKRLVALKTVLVGAHAGPEALARFKAEAEAVARLQHPNIVQIFEVGAHGGLPFFSLEFISGGTLAGRLKGGPLAAADAAALAEALARAVHYAHRQGVVHRDLKPANVLLTEEGVPKVTDFGLAKQLGAASLQTASGAVLGTPCYMAPEQAAGDSRAAGPEVDVYALGAILYEMLTGSPPFRGGTMLETLEQVRTREPKPPRGVRPGVPRDLETICLKCLRKEPAARYPSALALAQDLERYRSREPILARPEGPLGRFRRKLRRHRWAAAGVLIVAAAVGGAAFWAASGSRDRQVAALQAQIDRGLEPAEWSADRLGELLQGVEERIAALDPLAPELATADRERLHARARETLLRSLNVPRLGPDDVERFREDLRALAARGDPKVPELEAGLASRLQRWEEVFDLRPPFAGWDKTLPAEAVRAQDGRLTAAGDGARAVLTREACEGSVRLEAVFEPTWASAPRVGLLLNAGPGGPEPKGYALVVSAARDRDPDPPRPPPAGAGEADFYLQVRRDGACLREQAVRLPTGKPLALRATREGDRLTFQANELPPVVFLDVFSVDAAGRGACGVVWPAGAALARLRAERLAAPPAPSPLEQGDALYARGDVAGAAAAYEAYARAPVATPAGQEARFKTALCLTKLGRADEAVPLLEQVAGAPGDPWPAAAAGRLLLLLLERNRLPEAEAAFDSLAARYRIEDLIPVLPEDVRGRIVTQFFRSLAGANRLAVRPDAVAHAERLVQVSEFFRDGNFETRRTLVRAYQATGQDDRAARYARDFLRGAANLPPGVRRFDTLQMVMEYGRLLRSRGEPAPALAEVERWLAEAPDDSDPKAKALRAEALLERARDRAALGDRPGAERDVDACLGTLARPGVRNMYHLHSAAHLARGFLLEERGEAAGARAAWKEGCWGAWRAKLPEETRKEVPEQIPYDENLGRALEHVIMASLTGELSDAEAERLVAGVLSSSSGEALPAQMAGLVRVPPAAVRSMWQSKRGRDWARRIAYRQLSVLDSARAPVLLLAAEVLRHGAFGGAPSDEQDAVVWDAVEKVFGLFASGELGRTQVLQLGLTWKGTANFLGWGSVAPGLPPPARGPLAYAMGHRFLRLGKPAEAEAFFRTAADDAPDGTGLKRLARAELDKLRRK
jgi:serine/threonine-protein kinase